MAQVNVVKAFLLAVIIATFAASAQEVGMPPAQSPDAGAGFSLPVSGALIGTSLLFSIFAFFMQ
ncbi:hypothetical protein RND71_016536 [Anisodus tanguticus]|uniref:Uncharacterized protein n=1 Tax=Anisodus tanguticus TaxID=243964 RepID=A0AAE1S9G2_9SOLA|nr:hypothetical protein RND71_016536 [Anisodus tanguticus]